MDVDCGWRTGLGTCFYGRTMEARRIWRLIDTYSTLVLAGPRNVGKSELARYALRRVGGVRAVEVDARRARARRLVDLPDALAAEALRLVAERAGLGGLVELAVRAWRTLGLHRILLVDEFHLTSRDPIGDLEAIAKLLALYQDYQGWRLVVTVSEGWLMASGLEDRLEGYRARIYIVEPLGPNATRMLYEEYSEKHGCRLGLELYLGLVGGLPGYLPQLCSLPHDELLEWVGARLDSLAKALAETRLPQLEAVERAYRLLVEDREAETAEDHTVGERLVEHNIAYPKGLRYKPQLNIYRVALAHWKEKKRKPSPRKALEEAQETHNNSEAPGGMKDT